MKKFLVLCFLGAILALPGLALAQPGEAPEPPHVETWPAPDVRSAPLMPAPPAVEAPQTSGGYLEKYADSLLRRADAQLSWLMYGMGLFAMIATIGGTVLSWQIHSKAKSVEAARDQCEQMLKEVAAIRHTATEHADFINEQRRTLLSQAALDISSVQQEIAQRISVEDTTKTALFAEAVLETKIDNHKIALLLWRQYLKHDPVNVNALFNAAGAAYQSSLREDTQNKVELLHCAIGFLCRIPSEERTDLALFNWGRHLSTLGSLEEDTHEKLIWWRNAYRKYEEAAELNPSKPEIWNSLAGVMLHMLPYQINKDSWLDSAEEYCRKAELLAPGSGAYNLACVYSHQGHSVEECLTWLEKSLSAGKLPPLGYVKNDPDLGSLTSEPAFLEFVENVEKQSFVNTL